MSGSAIVDFDIHGIVRLRLVTPSATDVAAVSRQLGLVPTVCQGEPDVVVEFRNEIRVSGLKYLGLNFAGFSDEHFYVLGAGRDRVRMRFPFEEIGGRCEILCESGVSWVPLLTHVINLTFLEKGYLALHASAFEYEGVGALVVAWAKGGKTEALLSFGDRGARYVGDEWVILSRDGTAMFGIPSPICIWDWQFEYISNLKLDLGFEKRFLFKSIHLLDAINRALARGSFRRLAPVKILEKSLSSFMNELKVRILPEELFRGRIAAVSSPRKVFLMMSRDDPRTEVAPIDPLEVGRRMLRSNAYELNEFFFKYYDAFKFAFPERRNDFLEGCRELQDSMLREIFDGREAYVVFHPYPVPLPELFDKMQPFCTGNAEETPADEHQEDLSEKRSLP